MTTAYTLSYLWLAHHGIQPSITANQSDFLGPSQGLQDFDLKREFLYVTSQMHYLYILNIS